MSRLKRAADQNRAQAARLRENGREDTADRLEARAAELESGRVTDRTDAVSALISWGFGRR